MLCNATASPPPHRLQSVDEARAAGSRERQTEGVKVERDGRKRKRKREKEGKGKNRQGKEPDYRRGVRARGHEEDRQRRQNVIMNQLDAELLPYLVMRLDSSSQTDVLSRFRVQYQHDRSD